MWFDAQMKQKDITGGVKQPELSDSPGSLSYNVTMLLYFSVIYDFLQSSCLFSLFIHMYTIVTVYVWVGLLCWSVL